jgi:hypothetical protein
LKSVGLEYRESEDKYEDVSVPYKGKSSKLRESDTRFSTSGFLHESVSPGPLSITWGGGGCRFF